MRTILIILLVIAAIIGAAALYLVLTTPSTATPVRFPLSASQRALVARVPANADAFALVPTAALLQRKVVANPVTRDAVERWTSDHDVPGPWLLGGADAVIWRQQKKISYAVRLDGFRAFLVRLWLMSSSNPQGVWDGSVFVIGSGGAPFDARALDALLAPAKGLPEGDVLVVQRNRARGMFPPIARPALTSVRVTANAIDITSRAYAENGAISNPPIIARHPRNALLSVAFATPPRILGDLDRLLGAKISDVFNGGGSIALYDVDAGTLLPRPKGVLAVRSATPDVIRVAELVGETRNIGGEQLVSFDRDSMPLYLKDTFQPAPWPATRWSLRIDAQRIAPILEKLGDNRGLRVVAPRLHRAARDLRRWMGALREAQSIEAADSISGPFEELRVRIASK